MPPAYPGDIRTLTSLRFFAAAIIIIHHLKWFVPGWVTEASGIFEKGYLAVDFFFILSGFILTHAYLKSFTAGKFAARDFYVRRLARIYPLHLATLLLMAGICLTPLRFGPLAMWPGHFPPVSFADNLLLLHGWGTEQTLSFNAPSWSISTEWFAYLCFPFLLPFCLKKRAGFLLAGFCVTFAAIWGATALLDPARPMTHYSVDGSILRIMPEFAIGIALRLWGAVRAPVKNAGFWLALCSAAIFFCLHARVADAALIPLFIGTILCSADMERNGASTWLSHKIPVWLGEISYAVYMVHYPVLTIVLWSLLLKLGTAGYLAALPWLLPVALMLILFTAAAAHYGIERPGRMWATRMLSKASR